MIVTTRVVPVRCPICDGRGLVDNGLPMTNPYTLECPTCGGRRTVDAHETTYAVDSWPMKPEPAASMRPGYIDITGTWRPY